MGTTAQKLQYLVDAKAAIDMALTNKGVTPPTALADYSTAIGALGYKDKLQQIVSRTITEITREDLEGCTVIGSYAFYGCRVLTHVTLPNTVTTLKGYAFCWCSSLTSITVPENVISIEQYVFNQCYGLTHITFLATTPPTLYNSTVFSVTNNCPIYVPAESVEAYKAATNWSEFASRIQAIPV